MLVNPAKGNQLLDICYFGTAEEIDALWDDLEQKANSTIKASPEKFGNATFEELRDSNDPMVKKLYDSLRKKLLAYANEKSHAFVRHIPPSHVIKRLRNCGMHADHNFAKRILVFLVCLAVQIDVQNGFSKPLEEPNSKINHICNVLSSKATLVRIVKRIKEAVAKHGSSVSSQHFSWHLKGPNLVEFFNVIGVFLSFCPKVSAPLFKGASSS